MFSISWFRRMRSMSHGRQSIRLVQEALEGGCVAKTNNQRRRSHASLRPTLEVLESRWVPSLVTLTTFSYPSICFPRAGLIEDSSGNLFGTTIEGGTNGGGTVFELAAGANTPTILANFNGANGSDPECDLIEDSSGNLFGTTATGGAYGENAGDGTVFELMAGANTPTTLVNFDGADGALPHCRLVEDSSGNLFGTTTEGGAYGYGAGTGDVGDGTVFEVAAGTNTLTTLVNFNGDDGAYPHADLIEDSSGNFFGTTVQGGAYGDGTVFELTAGTNTLTTLVSFNNTNGANPSGGLIEDSNGNLFGTTEWGGAYGDGTVFELTAGTNTLTTLATFNNTNGTFPVGLSEDSSGNFFGMTQYGGAYGVGTVFELTAETNTLTTLATFNNTNGARPWDGVIEDGSGNIFGAAYYGGAYGAGTVFELTPLALTPSLANWTVNQPGYNQTITATGSIGGVAFDLAGGTLPTGLTLDSTGQLAGTPTVAGTYTFTVTATDSVGDVGSQTYTVIINGLATTTTLTDNGPNPSIYGQAVSFNASVTAGAGSDGETVLIEDASNANAVVASPTLTNGNVTFSISNLSVGTHNLFAVYNGDANNAPSDSSMNPVSQVVNASGVTLFVTDADGVDEYTTTGVYLTNFVPIGTGGLDNNYGSLRFGPDGNLYVCDGSYVKEYDGVTGAFLGTFASGLNSATDIIFDASGNAFVSDYFGNAVDEFSSAGTLLQTFSSGVSTPAGLAFAPNGDLLVANTYFQPYANTITEINTTTGSYSTFATGLGEPVGLIEGPGGNYYAGNFTYAGGYGGTNPDTIQVIQPSGGASSTWNTGGDLHGTDFLAFADGDLFATSYYNSQVVRFDGMTGAFVSSFTTGNDLYGIAARPAGTTTALTDSGPNPSTYGQAVTFTVTVGDGSTIDGETVLIEDASNANAVVASPTITGGTATFDISNLSVGTHNLFAVYNGDTDYAASDSSQNPVTQNVIAPGPSVSSVVINQDISALYNAAGQPSPGVQRSMVDDIVYTFSESVNILTPAVDPNVFTAAVAPGWTGTVPTLNWAAIAGSNDTQWAVTFSGAGVTGGSIANGAYTITITDPASIAAESDGQTLSLASSGIDSPTQSFYRLFGDINGDGVVNAADNLKFKQALTTYNGAFDYNQDGVVNAADNLKFKNDLTVNFSGFTPTI